MIFSTTPVLLKDVYVNFCLLIETLIATRTVGIQVEQKNILGKSKYVKYVPIENIKAVIINEIIRRVCLCSYHYIFNGTN